ncbi:hypothetical protein J2T15_005727 [Paenibacillus harenae]|uniref:Uncharacterized protein n=1 Tax=Paenibacillus harenae TaxID=306543 RepID=A0ABT9U9E2_PAEHA|nr:hypothetical protein [Paenibacillus harenae]
MMYPDSSNCLSDLAVVALSNFNKVTLQIVSLRYRIYRIRLHLPNGSVADWMENVQLLLEQTIVVQGERVMRKIPKSNSH